MLKKGVLIGIFLVAVMLLPVLADISVQDVFDITFVGSSSVYEFQSKNVTLFFFFNNQTTLSSISLWHVGVNVTEVKVPANPDQQNSTFLRWNRDAQSIQLAVRGLEVGADTAGDWVVMTNDTNGNVYTEALAFTVQNDNLAPRYQLNSPLNYSIQQNGTVSFSITVTEPESGLSYANVHYDYVGAVGTKSEFTDTLTLTCAGDTCTGSVERAASSILGYYFEVVDRAGNKDYTSWNDARWHYVYVDAELPKVVLNEPLANAYVPGLFNVSYNASDDEFAQDALFSPSVTCSLFAGNTTMSSQLSTRVLTANVSSALLEADIRSFADGVYTLAIVCGDSAGWEKQSELRSVFLDRTGPVIILEDPLNNSVILNGTILDFDVTDALSGVAAVEYSLNGGAGQLLATPYRVDTAFWSGVSDVVVSATDTLGNPSAVSFRVIVDVNGPIVKLVSPLNGSFLNGLLVANATDDYQTDLLCAPVVDGVVNMSVAVPEGTHAWSVECFDLLGDGFGNAGVSENRTVIVDRTAPEIELTSPGNGTNSPLPFLDYGFVIREDYITPADNCSLFVNDLSRGRLAVVDNTLLPSNNPYTWFIGCEDYAGNVGFSPSWTVYYDIIAPVLSPPVIDLITTSGMRVSWLVDGVNNSVYYGINQSALTIVQREAVRSMTPALTLTGLTEGTTYFVIAESCDQFGLCSNSSVVNATTVSSPPGGSSSSGGGGGRRSSLDEVEEILVCTENWSCGDWSSCVDRQQSRICSDVNSCGTEERKPIESRSCTVPVVDTVNVPVEPSVSSPELATEENQLPPGVGQAVGLFNQLKANGKTVVAGAAVISALSGLAIWQRKSMFKSVQRFWNWKDVRVQKEEELIKEKLREKGFLK